jgi:hypothetical protein
MVSVLNHQMLLKFCAKVPRFQMVKLKKTPLLFESQALLLKVQKVKFQEKEQINWQC